MNFFENISVAWQRLGLVQKAMLGAIVVACGITGLFLTKWASTPDMRPLFTGVSPEDAGKITDKISEKGIVFELKGTGSIFVPKEHVYQLRADLAKDGLPGGNSPGYSLFDDGGFAKSPFLQNVNLTRALQDEIARSISMFDCITGARVHIVRPDQNVFNSEVESSRASVVLQLKPGFQISQATVAAVSHMVASSVEGLDSENVTIVNNQGRLLNSVKEGGISSSANTFMDYKERVEQGLAERAERMLETVLGPGRSSIVVSAMLDMDSEDRLVTTYERGVPSKEEINETSKISETRVDKDGNPVGTGDNETESQIVTEMLVPETTVKTSKTAGKILSISVAAVVDLTVPAPASAPVEDRENENTAAVDVAPVKIMTVDQVKELIFSALGRDLLKDENLSVVDTPFNRPPVPQAVKEPWHVAYIGLFKQASLGIMAVCALMALKIFSGKITGSAGAGSGRAAASLSEGSVAGMLPAGDTREQIAMAFKSDPEQVRELFTSWIEEKG